MTDRRLDVLAIGNAIVDVIADADDDFLAREGMHKGAMRLIDESEAARLYEAMGPAREVERRVGGEHGRRASPRSGFAPGFIGQLADDQLGEILRARHPQPRRRVRHAAPKTSDRRHRALPDPGDARRAADDEHLPRRRADAAAGRGRRAQIAAAQILYLEGYLWDPADAARRDVQGDGRGARRRARRSPSLCPTASSSIATATISRGCSTSGASTSCSPTRPRSRRSPADARLESAVAALKDKVETLVVTRSEHGALAVRGGERAEVPAEPIAKLVDTTGAGDLFAAGFLAGEARGPGLEQSLRLGAICAAEVIQHYGARPEADLRALAGDLLA